MGMRKKPYSGCVYADGWPGTSPNVPWWTNVCAKSSLLSVNDVRIAPRSCSRTTSRGAIAATATSQRCARLTPPRSPLARSRGGNLVSPASPLLANCTLRRSRRCDRRERQRERAGKPPGFPLPLPHRRSRGDENRCFDVLAHPELEHQEAPQAVAVVGATGFVVIQESRDRFRAEPTAVGREQISRD